MNEEIEINLVDGFYIVELDDGDRTVLYYNAEDELFEMHGTKNKFKLSSKHIVALSADPIAVEQEALMTKTIFNQ